VICSQLSPIRQALVMNRGRGGVVAVAGRRPEFVEFARADQTPGINTVEL
jgi:hypothetical protein